MDQLHQKRQRYALLQDRLVRFAAAMVAVAGRLPTSAAGRHYADQLVRSGGAPARQYAEAQGAESKADFVHKMKIGLKELRETAVTLQTIRCCRWISDAEIDPWIQENNELIAIFVRCIYPKHPSS